MLVYLKEDDCVINTKEISSITAVVDDDLLIQQIEESNLENLSKPPYNKIKIQMIGGGVFYVKGYTVESFFNEVNKI